MSDIEHELLKDRAALRERVRQLAELAHRALVTARDAQDAAGGHDPWLDEAIAEVRAELVAAVQPSSES